MTHQALETARLLLGSSLMLTAPGVARVIIEALAGRLAALQTPAKPERRGLLFDPRPVGRPGGRVAIIPLVGVIGQHMNEMLDFLGGTSSTDAGRAFDEAMADPTVKAVLLDVESPGGSVFGTPELAAKIKAARGTKPIVAVANAYAASAAYWIASAADKLYVTPSGQVGSVGAYLVREDATKLYDAIGLDLHVISAGKFKTEGLPYVAMTEEEQTDLQAYINETYDAFVSGVAVNRGVSSATVRKSYGEGRMMSAGKAKAAGMVDGIKTFDDVLGGLLKATAKGQRLEGAAACAELLSELEAEAPEAVTFHDDDPDMLELEMALRAHAG